MPSFPPCGTGAVTGPLGVRAPARDDEGSRHDLDHCPRPLDRRPPPPTVRLPPSATSPTPAPAAARHGRRASSRPPWCWWGPPRSAADGDLPGGRRIVDHTVRAGETATGLAVRYHAWTAELITPQPPRQRRRARVGQRLEIPVVVAALPHRRADRDVTHHAPRHARTAPRRRAARRSRRRPPAGPPGRRTVGRAPPHRRGVDPQLALAVSWQESGWQMDRRSDAGRRRCHAGAARQRPLDGAVRRPRPAPAPPARQRHRRGHAAAGAGRRDQLHRRAVAAYYQGLGAVREHGLYGETRAYVANVTAIRARLEAGRPPA